MSRWYEDLAGAALQAESTTHANNTTRSKTTATSQRAFKRLRITTEGTWEGGRHKLSSSKLELYYRLLLEHGRYKDEWCLNH